MILRSSEARVRTPPASTMRLANTVVRIGDFLSKSSPSLEKPQRSPWPGVPGVACNPIGNTRKEISPPLQATARSMCFRFAPFSANHRIQYASWLPEIPSKVFFHRFRKPSKVPRKSGMSSRRSAKGHQDGKHMSGIESSRIGFCNLFFKSYFCGPMSGRHIFFSTADGRITLLKDAISHLHVELCFLFSS